MPNSPAVVLESILKVWPTLRQTSTPREFFSCVSCTHQDHNLKPDNPIQYGRNASTDKPLTKAQLEQLISATQACRCRNTPGRVGVRPGELWFVESPYGAPPVHNLIMADGGSYKLVGVVAETEPEHVAAMIAADRCNAKVEWCIIGDGAFVPSVRPPSAAWPTNATS